jgi:hypothetical protein
MICTRLVDTVTRWPFLVALATLLLNDFWLKGVFPGFVTGKLSDVAGIAMLALPLLAAFPRRALAIYLAIGLAFLWWKSPWSGGFIVFANDVLPYSIGRVVDYGDLIALFVLPPCRLAAARKPVRRDPSRRWVAVPAVIAATFATAATSYVSPRYDMTIRTVDSNGTLPAHVAVRAIEEAAKEYGMECVKCPEPDVRGAYVRGYLSMQYRIVPPNAVRFSISQGSPWTGNSSGRKAERFREELKRAFQERVKGLEVIQPLDRGYTIGESYVDPQPRGSPEPAPEPSPAPAPPPAPHPPKPRPTQDPAPAPVA